MTLVCSTSVAQAATFSDEEGWRAYDSGDYGLARQIWEALAEAGHPQAQFGLGILHDLGNGIASDQAVAYHWYHRAAEAGLPAAEFNVAVMIDSGRGVPREPAVAALWYAKAASHGHGRAQYDLGQLYETGDGVPRNVDQAAVWFRAAAAGGVKAAGERFRIAAAAQASRPMAPVEALAPPTPEAPTDRTEIDATFNPVPVELVWTAPVQPVPVTFFVEMLRVDLETPREVFSGYTDQSAVLAATAVDRGVYAWRVYTVGRDVDHYSVSAWQLFKIKHPMTTAETKQQGR